MSKQLKAAPKRNLRNIEGFVSRKEAGMDKTSSHVSQGIKSDGKPMGEVRVEIGNTINLGNYSSVRVSVGISVPCSADDLEKAYRHALTWTKGKMEEQVCEIRKANPGVA